MPYYTNLFDDHVLSSLKNDGVGLIPTDTIYGLSANIHSKQAINRIFELKQRPEDRTLIVLIGNLDQLEELGVSRTHSQALVRHWPAPLTVVFDVDQKTCPKHLVAADQTIAVRMPKYDLLTEFLVKSGPIVSTSANLRHQTPATSYQEALEYFNDQLDFYVDVGILSAKPSTLVRQTSNGFDILRQGDYSISN